MTASFQYKTTSGGAATDVPVEAWPRDDGTVFVEYPKATELDGLGAPCAAIGKPRIVFRSSELTGAGIDFWQDLFSTSTAESVTIWLTAFNPRSKAWGWWTGTLLRPKFSDPSPAASLDDTIFRDVEIIVNNCTVVV